MRKKKKQIWKGNFLVFFPPFFLCCMMLSKIQHCFPRIKRKRRKTKKKKMK